MQEIQNNEIIIELSKSKIALLTIGAIGFVLAGLWLWSITDTQTRYDPTTIKIVATASVGFFGLCGIYGLIKFFDSKPGLIIGEKGILDNSNAVGGKLIRWEDITGFEIEQVKSTRFLLIFVKNPHDYLQGANFFKRFWMRLNEKMYGTPLSISANSLKCNLDELISTIGKKLESTDAQHQLYRIGVGGSWKVSGYLEVSP